jgi:hypothetical protein
MSDILIYDVPCKKRWLLDSRVITPGGVPRRDWERPQQCFVMGEHFLRR